MTKVFRATLREGGLVSLPPDVLVEVEDFLAWRQKEGRSE